MKTRTAKVVAVIASYALAAVIMAAGASIFQPGTRCHSHDGGHVHCHKG